MTEQDAKNLGFIAIPHFTVNNGYTYDLGRDRFLSFGGIGTPNEMLFICEKENHETKIIDNLVVLHNFDYDGLITIEKLTKIKTVLGI